MADEKKLNIDMEEYSIPEEGGSNYHSEQSIPIYEGMSKRPAKGKRLLIPVVLVIAIIVFYQILSWYSHREGQQGLKDEQEVARKTQQSMITPPKVAEPVVVTPAPVNVPPPVVPATSESEKASSDVQSKLDILANRTDLNSQQLDKVQGSFLKLQTALVALSRTMGDLSNSVQDVTKQVQKLSAPKQKPVKIKKIEKPKQLLKVIYNVKAVVSGLAWLESPDGRTTSVRVGDKLDGYGVVQLISPQQGTVITSDGSVIQYGVNDF